MSVSEKQKIKRKLRGTKAWKTLRHEKNIEQGGIDPLTNKKLSKTANLHHMDLNSEHYLDIEDHERFLMLNKNSHDTIHFLYNYYVKDREIINRLVDILDKMVEINN